MPETSPVNDQWLLPSGACVKAQALSTLVTPSLTRDQHARNFRFFENALLVVTSGQLVLDHGQKRWVADDALTLTAVAKHTVAHVSKTPDTRSAVFTSLFFTLAPGLLTEFHQRYGQDIPPASLLGQCRQTVLNDDLNDTLQFCVRGFQAQTVSPLQQTNRLMGLLLALKERGIVFARPSAPGIAERLTQLLAKTPEQDWTAAQAGRELAVSEATLRRRLAQEGVNFSHLLAEIRMHHAMMLLQTTHFSVSQIADACGYRALSRFSARFKSRFGCSAHDVR